MAKALGENEPDCEGRRLGERKGLDTPVVLAVKDAGQMLHIPRGYAVSEGSR